MKVFFFGLGYCARRLVQSEPWIEASGTARAAASVAALRREGVDAYRFDGAEAELGLEATLGKAEAIVLDVSQKADVTKVADQILAKHGRIDLLVNNAGIFVAKPFTDYTEDDYNLVMNTNVASFFYMTQQVSPQMKKQNSGHVVNISGASVDQPSRTATELLAVLSKSPMPIPMPANACPVSAYATPARIARSVNVPSRLL